MQTTFPFFSPSQKTFVAKAIILSTHLELLNKQMIIYLLAPEQTNRTAFAFLKERTTFFFSLPEMK